MPTMDAFGAGIAQTMVAISSPLRNSVTAAQQSVYNTDEQDIAEQGLSLGNMDAEGLRQRNVAAEHVQESVDNREGASTSTSEGIVTPSSTEDTSQSPGSFAKASWRRMSSGLDWSFFSRASAGSEDSLEHKYGHDLFKKERLEDFPLGFPRLSALVSSDDDLAIVRSFKTLHNRILLQDQVEITELEKRLSELDKEDEGNPETAHRLIRTKHKEGWDSRQRDLLREVRIKLKEYDEMVLYHARMQELGRPPKRNHIHYWNWIWTNKPLAKGYWDYIYWADDFVTLAGNHRNYFQDLIQGHMLYWPRSPIKWLLRLNDGEKPTTDKAVTYYSQRKLGMLSQVFLVSVAVGMLLIPAYLLFLVPMSRPKMAMTVAAFLLPFASIMSAVNKVGGVYETFVGTATYGAVLIMFLGNIGGNGPVVGT